MPLPHPYSRALSLIGISLACALALEVGLRAAHFEYPKPSMRGVVWSKTEDAILRSADGLHQIDEREIWKPRPGARIPWCAEERVNSQGYRGPELALDRNASVVRIALLGGSATFGYGREWKDTYASLLVDELAARHVRAEVLCAGVMNSTARQGLERYRALVRPYRPDLLLCAYSGTAEHQQAWHSFTDESRIKFGCGMLLKPPERSLWISLRSDLRLLHLIPWLTNVHNGAYWEEAFVDMHEARIDATIGLLNAPVMRRVPLGDFRESLVALSRDARADGASLMLVTIPRRASFYPQSPMLERYERVMGDIAREEGLAVLRQVGVVQEDCAPGVTTESLIPDETHSGESAHLVLARSLADILEKLPGMRH